MKGHIAWNKGKGEYLSPEARERVAQAHRGKSSWNKGYGEYIRGDKNPMYGKKRPDTITRNKQMIFKGNKNGMFGKKRPDFSNYLKDKIKKGLLSGINNPNWKGGKSFEVYPSAFNRILKEKIRTRDNYICQECHKNQSKLKRKLVVHHIDFNKKNNIPENLISLCNSCHSKTNFNREQWIKYFQNKINIKLIVP